MDVAVGLDAGTEVEGPASAAAAVMREAGRTAGAGAGGGLGGASREELRGRLEARPRSSAAAPPVLPLPAAASRPKGPAEPLLPLRALALALEPPTAPAADGDVGRGAGEGEGPAAAGCALEPPELPPAVAGPSSACSSGCTRMQGSKQGRSGVSGGATQMWQMAVDHGNAIMHPHRPHLSPMLSPGCRTPSPFQGARSRSLDPSHASPLPASMPPFAGHN
jgi:hypothetical protein